MGVIYNVSREKADKDIDWYIEKAEEFLNSDSDSVKEYLKTFELPFERYFKDFAQVYEICLHRRISINIDSMVNCFLEEMQNMHCDYVNLFTKDDLKDDFNLFITSTQRFFIVYLAGEEFKKFIENHGYESIQTMQGLIDGRVMVRRWNQEKLEQAIEKNVLESVSKKRLKEIRKKGFFIAK